MERLRIEFDYINHLPILAEAASSLKKGGFDSEKYEELHSYSGLENAVQHIITGNQNMALAIIGPSNVYITGESERAKTSGKTDYVVIKPVKISEAPNDSYINIETNKGCFSFKIDGANFVVKPLDPVGMEIVIERPKFIADIARYAHSSVYKIEK